MEESEKRRMSRRKFIAGIALTGAGLASGNVLNAAEIFGSTGGSIRGGPPRPGVAGIQPLLCHCPSVVWEIWKYQPSDLAVCR